MTADGRSGPASGRFRAAVVAAVACWAVGGVVLANAGGASARLASGPPRPDAPRPTMTASPPPAVTGPEGARVIVRLDPDAGGDVARGELDAAQAELATDLVSTGSRTVRELETLPVTVVEATPEGLEALAESSVVASIEPDRILRADLSSSTVVVGADDAWGMGYDGTGQTVAVLDTGIEAGHAVFGGRVVHEACFTDRACPNGASTQVGAGSARACTHGVNCWHGTHVTGIAAGSNGAASGVARGADIMAVQVFSPGGGYVLDGWGGIHRVGPAAAIGGSPYWLGWDIARDLALRSDHDSGYVLDGWGGLHRVGGAPAVAGAAYWPGWDIARGLALRTDASGYVLDGWGGLHKVGNAPSIAGGPYWPGWDIARDVALHPDGGGYVLDGWGGIHAFGGAPAVSGSRYWPGWDIARSLVLLPDGSGGYVLDGWGGIHRFGTAPRLTGGPYWAGWSIARGMDVVPEALAYVSDVVAGLDHVYGQRTSYDVAAVNLSLGGGTSTSPCDGVSPTMDGALSQLRQVAVAPVAAAGNNARGDALSFPACITHAVSVGSTNDSDTLSGFTNRASFLDLFAPGESVTSAIPGSFGTASGTSMATPHVAGAFAVLAQKSSDDAVATLLAALGTSDVTITVGGTAVPVLRVDQALDEVG